MIGFAALNAVLYFGFGDRTIVANLDIAIYTIVAAMIVLSLIRRRPWTEQFAKRMVPAHMWERPAFHTINMRISFCADCRADIYGGDRASSRAVLSSATDGGRAAAPGPSRRRVRDSCATVECLIGRF